MNALMKWCSTCSRWLAWLGGLALLCSAVLISLDVVFRAIWNANYFESFELSTYAFAIATATGMSYALVSKAHIRIELLYIKLSPKWRAWLDVWAYTGLAVVSITLVYWCAQTVIGNLDTGARSNTSLAIPLAIPQSMWLLGLLWLAVVSTLFALFGLIKVITGRHEEANHKLGMASLQEEIEAGIRKELK